MSSEVMVIGLLVGLVNYLFRYLPLRLRAKASAPAKRGTTSILLDSIGIASICALLIVSSAPEIIQHPWRLLPTLAGFAMLGICFYKTRTIILPTLLSALAYGLVWKIVTSM